MPNQSISLANYDPETAKIQRQQQLAQMLQEQSLAPPETNSYNGIQAPISPFSVLAKVLSAYASKKMADKSDTQYQDLQTKRRQEFADALSKQYQVPDKPAQGVTLPEIAPAQTQFGPVGGQAADPTQGAVANAQAPRPTTPDEQLTNATQMMSSGNPLVSEMAPDLYKTALQRQQAAQLLSGLDLSNVPQRVRPIIQAQITQGDTAGAMKTYGDATKPMSVGGNIVSPIATGYQTDFAAKPAAVQEYEYAKQNGFKGSLTDYQKSKAQATHITVNGGGSANPDTIANWAKNVHSGLATIQQVPLAIRNDVSNFLGQEVNGGDSPIVAQRQTLASSRITAPYTKMSQYQLAADAQPYIQRMAAAAKHPGSIGDADLLDSLIKLNTGGNAITEAQASLVTGGRSISDTLSVMGNKLKTGGVLSNDQRQQILAMGKEIASNYQKGFGPVYAKATKQLEDAHIPKQYWTIPDINSFAEMSGFGGGASGAGGKGPPPPPGFVVQP